MDNTQTGHQAASSRRSGGWLWFWLLLALLLGAGSGYLVASSVGEESAARRYSLLKTQFEVVTAQHRHDYQVLKANMDTLQGRLLVEESTRKSLEATLQSTQEELGRARDQLAFFDRLLPPGPNGAVSIRALDFEPHGPTLSYKVLLMRNAPGMDAFVGQLQFVASGTLGGEKAELVLQPATASGAGDVTSDVPEPDADALAQGPLALQFEQFQRSEGLLTLPDGFQAATITLNVLEGKTLRVSRTVSLPASE